MIEANNTSSFSTLNDIIEFFKSIILEELKNPLYIKVADKNYYISYNLDEPWTYQSCLDTIPH